MIEPKETVIIDINKAKNTVQPKVGAPKNGIIVLKEETQEDYIMPQDNYSKSEIDAKLDKIDLKINMKSDMLAQTMENGFKQVELKFDTFEKRIENMFLIQENKRLEEQAKNKKEFTYWAIGILITLAGIAIPIWFGK